MRIISLLKQKTARNDADLTAPFPCVLKADFVSLFIVSESVHPHPNSPLPFQGSMIQLLVFEPFPPKENSYQPLVFKWADGFLFATI